MTGLVDFHSHILPGIDDGAEDENESLKMLADSYAQGVRGICATPHFYAFEESPDSFLKRRKTSILRLAMALKESTILYPSITVGAEVHYYSGMSESVALEEMVFGQKRFLLVEPPMEPWSDYMIDEIELTGKKRGCIPVIAHIDRYMRLLGDRTLISRLQGRRVLVQANNSFFLKSDSESRAKRLLAEGKIHFLGSDCHSSTYRPQNSGAAAALLEADCSYVYRRLHKTALSAVFAVDNP